MLNMTDTVLTLGTGTQNFFSGTETTLQCAGAALQSCSFQYSSMAAELRDPREHPAVLASSWRGPAEPSAFRAARPAGPGIRPWCDRLFGDHAPSCNPSLGTNLVLKSSPVPKCSTKTNLGLSNGDSTLLLKTMV